MTIKAIQTKYKGYHFRSRLEARWAVFFDACGYTWEYEPEGFDLGDGVYYLPDFKVYGVDDNGDSYVFWFEIKPEGVALSESELSKINAFKDAIRKDAYGSKDYLRKLTAGYGDYIILEGVPTNGKMHHGTLATDCDGSLWILDPVYRGRPSFFEPDYEWISSVLRWPCGSDDYLKGRGCPYEKARSARFEHGDSPK